MARSPRITYNYQLRYKFSGTISDIEEWLEVHCEGAYQYELEEVVETEAVFNQLCVLFKFQHDADRRKFKQAIKSGII